MEEFKKVNGKTMNLQLAAESLETKKGIIYSFSCILLN